MIRLTWLGWLPLLVAACSPTGWDAEVCAGDDLELIDRAIGESYAIESYMDDLLAHRFDDSYPSYGQIIEQLVDYRSREAIHCGAYSNEEQRSPSAENQGEILVIATNNIYWTDALADWEAGQEYGRLGTQGVEEAVAVLSEYEYYDLTDQARAYLTAPAIPLRFLSHEAAHASIRDCCHHTRDTSMAQRGGCDFVDTVGWLAMRGLLWERWIPEKQWLDQLFLDR